MPKAQQTINQRWLSTAVDDQNLELATGKALALLELELFFGITGLPRRVLFTRDDPHAMRRLRHRARADIGQEMRPLQHALLWARMPETALGGRRA